MRCWFCQQCGRGFHVCGANDEVARLLIPFKGSIPCITPLCGGRMNSVEPLTLNAPLDSLQSIEVTDFYRRIHGQGGASLKKVRNVFAEKSVVEVVGRATGEPERTLLEQLIFADGTRMHFGLSQQGACIYHLEEPHVHSEAAVEGGDTDREEAGRATEALNGADKLGGEQHSGSHAGSVEPTGTKPVSAVPATGGLPTSSSSAAT